MRWKNVALHVWCCIYTAKCAKWMKHLQFLTETSHEMTRERAPGKTRERTQETARKNTHIRWENTHKNEPENEPEKEHENTKHYAHQKEHKNNEIAREQTPRQTRERAQKTKEKEPEMFREYCCTSVHRCTSSWQKARSVYKPILWLHVASTLCRAAKDSTGRSPLR